MLFAKTQIFPIYFKPARIYQSSIFTPIQAGAVCHKSLPMLSDFGDEPDSISWKNPHYAEMTAWYHIWKHYLPKHPEIQYVGFGHYRRFLNLTPISTNERWNEIYESDFVKLFDKYYDDEATISRAVSDYDVILPYKTPIPTSVEQGYLMFHPKKEWDIFKTLAKTDTDSALVDDVLAAHSCYYKLQFVMRTCHFENFCSWLFPKLFELEKYTDYSKYTTYNTIRTPAFIVERFFNVWLERRRREQCGLNIKEVGAYFVVPDNVRRLRYLKLFLSKKTKNYVERSLTW